MTIPLRRPRKHLCVDEKVFREKGPKEVSLIYVELLLWLFGDLLTSFTIYEINDTDLSRETQGGGFICEGRRTG